MTTLLVGVAAARAGEFSLAEYLSIQTAQRPTFDAQGTECAFVWDVTGIPQIWRIHTLGGFPVQVTFQPEGVGGCWWSPFDLGKLLVAVPADKKAAVQLWMINPRSGERVCISEDSLAAHEFGCWAPDGSRIAYTVKRKDRAETEIIECRIQTRERHIVYKSSGLIRAAAYSPDNRFLLIERANSAYDHDLFLYEYETDATRLLTEAYPGARFLHPVWDRDAAGFHLLTDHDREYLGLAYWSLDSAHFSWIETPDADIEEFAISRDGGFLAWTVGENGFSNLHVRNLRRGTDIPPGRFPVGLARDLRFSNDGSKLAYSFATTDRGYDVWFYETHADKLRQATISAVGGIPPETLVRPVMISYTAQDGKTIPALWHTPLSPDGKLPVIVAIMGGPNQQSRFDLSPWLQYFLNRGWAVLEPNVRGSSGYGKSYASMDDGENRAVAISDVAASVEWLAARKDVDQRRIVVLGQGHGGFLALAALAESPKLWSAGVCISGFADVAEHVESAPLWKRSLLEAEFGVPGEMREKFAANSLLHRAAGVSAHVFLAGDSGAGMAAFREALLSNNGTMDFFPWSSGDLCSRDRRIALYTEVEKFLNRHVLKR